MGEKPVLFTAGKIAESLNVSAGQIKKAIETLKIEPDSKKGACNYYAAETVEKIKKSLGK
ncbi:MAG: hypothetical protein K9I71_08890 [Ignavibacteriales bacterium]|nr:hypothetical protein [Ignavibacteriales bacterium]MCF8316228.1 hypothetical protein [Ignavibacteriales bacterium]MCF8437812.1 hypothetical protein [Ignavibacteriales bacterium]